MRTSFYLLFAAIVMVASASAAPQLIVDTIVTETDTAGKDTQLAHFHVLTKDGEQTVMPVGETKYAATPVLHKNGTVDVSSTYTHPTHTGKDVKLGPQKQTSPLGERRDVSYGAVTFSTKVLKAK